MFYNSDFVLISFVTMRNCFLYSLIGSGNWNICVTNLEKKHRDRLGEKYVDLEVRFREPNLRITGLPNGGKFIHVVEVGE